jgi:hypothetical protein
MRRQATTGALLLIAVGVVLGSTVFRSDIAQATGLAQSVVVSNTASNPVPVHEQGTASVSVVDNHEPFQQALNVNLDGGDFSGTDLFTVPEGKRLVLQYIAVSAAVPPDEGVSVSYRVGNALGTSAGVPIVSGGLEKTSAGDFVQWAGGGPVLAYANPGQNVWVELQRESSLSTGTTGGGIAGMTAILAGYLVPSS